MTAPRHISAHRTSSERTFAPFVEAFCVERGWTMVLDYQIGPYFPDMIIEEQKLVIEIDGNYHDKIVQMAKDFKRNSYMRKRGWVVFRFANDQIEKDPEWCIGQLKAFLRHNLIIGGK